jgi:hypothetical protein
MARHITSEASFEESVDDCPMKYLQFLIFPPFFPLVVVQVVLAVLVRMA